MLIRRYLQAVGAPAPEEADLVTLVAAVKAHEDAFWSEHDPYGKRFSKRLPWWGCLATLLAVVAVACLIQLLLIDGS